MKITFLSAFYPYRGGIAQFNALLYRELEKSHQLNAYTFKRQYPDFLFPGQTQYVSEKDKADKIPALRTLDTVNPISYLKTANKINNDEPDILITRYWMSFFAPSLGMVLKKIGKQTKRICIVDNMIPHEKRFFDAAFNRFFVKQVDGFVVMSDKVLNDLLSIKPDAKYLRINHPVYNHFGEKLEQKDAQNQLKLNTSKKTLLFFGIIRDYKGLDVLLEAIKFLDNSYQLIIAGEVYGSFEKYEKLIRENNLNEKVHLFNKYIDDLEVPLYFSAADVCILPYKSATQSGITAIANHFNLPIIATDVGGLKESISDNETGIIVEKVDPQQIASAIESYFTGNKKSLFTANIEAHKKKDSWNNFANEVLAFSDKVSRL